MTFASRRCRRVASLFSPPLFFPVMPLRDVDRWAGRRPALSSNGRQDCFGNGSVASSNRSRQNIAGRTGGAAAATEGARDAETLGDVS